MISVILTILKILGLILLILLGILILVVCLVLFIPVRYRIEGDYQSSKATVSSRVTWLQIGRASCRERVSASV